MYKKDRERLKSRQTNTLIGISKGVISDGVVNQKEAEFLLNWLETSETYVVENPLVDELYERILTALEDGFLDEDEKLELFDALKAFAGDKSELGEMIKSAMPLNDPQPPIIFEGKVFLLTGDEAHRSRKEYHDEIVARGGQISEQLTLKTDYLVIGKYASPKWKHESYGTKINRAVDYRKKHGKPAIISEDHFADSFRK